MEVVTTENAGIFIAFVKNTLIGVYISPCRWHSSGWLKLKMTQCTKQHFDEYIIFNLSDHLIIRLLCPV